MVKRAGFDNEKYLKEQTAAILERVRMFHNKLYLEFGGKLIFDYHASRVLPGFDPDVKMRLLQQLRNKADILLCIYSGDTADIRDFNLIDPFHLEAYNKTAVNYNRDVEVMGQLLGGRTVIARSPPKFCGGRRSNPKTY